MKKIIFILLILPLGLHAQTDSTVIRINGIVLKGRDTDVALAMIKDDPSRYFVMDSLLKTVYTNPPGNATDVAMNNIPNKEWFRLFKSISQNAIAVNPFADMFKRLDTEFRLHGSAWLIHKMDLWRADFDALYDGLKKSGQKYGKRQDDSID